jgi:type IV secretory pathway protease TraF
MKRAAFLILAAFWVVTTLMRWHFVTLNLTDSEPRGIYIPTSGTPGTGAMVELRPLLKHVRGRPGDIVNWSPAGVSINGAPPIPNTAPPKNLYGYRLQPFGTYHLGLGQYWLVGTGRDSWDSRITGPFPWDALAFNIKPFWTSVFRK